MELRLSLSGERVNPYLVERFSSVGLIRGEYLLRVNDEHITLKSCQETLQNYLADIAKSFYPNPVWYRCIELWSDEANTLPGNDLELHEQNPMAGYRGLRRAFKMENTFETELRLVKEVADDYSNLNLIFPFVGDADEFARGVQFLDKVQWSNRIGSMIEIPSAVLDTRRLVEEGASNLMIGVNDLSCFMLGADRINGFDNKLHRALWWAIDHVRENANGTEWGIAGNLTKDFIQEAEAHNVPYVSLHYFDLENSLGISHEHLPEKGLVPYTKVKTKSRVHDYTVQHFLKEQEALKN